MTKDEFIDRYCRRSGVTRGFLMQHVVALRCDCGEDGCQGWQMVGKKNLEMCRDLYEGLEDEGGKE